MALLPGMPRVVWRRSLAPQRAQKRTGTRAGRRDTGVNGEYVEVFTVPAYEYYKTPLRAASENDVASSIVVDETALRFIYLPSNITRAGPFAR